MELQEQIVQIQRDISDLKKGQASSRATSDVGEKGQASSTATSDMDDLESLFSSFGSDSPFSVIPPSTRLFSPPPALSPPFLNVYRPRATSLPILPGGYDSLLVAMDCQSPAVKPDVVLQSHPAAPSTSLSSPQSVQHLPISSQTAQPPSNTCAPSASLELPPTSPFQTSSAPLTLPLSISQAELSVAPLPVPAPNPCLHSRF